MLKTEERNLVERCLFDINSGVAVNNRYFLEDEIVQFLEDCGMDSSALNNIKRLFQIDNAEWCEKHSWAFSNCDCDGQTKVDKRRYVLDAEVIAEEWGETIEEFGIFDSISVEDPKEGMYRLLTQYGGRKIAFEMFVDGDILRKNQLTANHLEFPVSLIDSQYLEEIEYGLYWTEFFTDQFSKRLDSTISSIKSNNVSSFHDYNSDFVSDHREDIRETVWEFFDESGYTVRSDVEEHCTEIEKYEIPNSSVDFVCLDGDEKLLVCHCGERDDLWHIHRFVERELVSAEEVPEFVTMRKRLKKKIRYRRDISESMDVMSRWTRGLVAGVTVVTGILSLYNVAEITGLINDYLSTSVSQNDVWTALLVMNLLLILCLMIVIVEPYLRIRLFRWKITPQGETPSRIKFIRHWHREGS